jgi:hypothetical protein
MNEYGGIEMGVKQGKGKAVEIDAHQGGNKAAPRPGTTYGEVEHHKVDMIDHAGHSSRAKSAMADMGHYNVEYYNGGKQG